VTRPGFRVDLRSCTGCKACQVACIDRHGLGPRLRWRRVVEVAAGQWQRDGAVWRDRTRTYFVSVACMHCARPICAEVCPTGAMVQGPDGIVTVTADRCLGCRLCEWACPYAAPQFDEDAGVMTKCDLCQDRLAAGRLPACVAACQMRVLTLVDLDEAQDGVDEVFPLPPAHLTLPSVSLTPHRDAAGVEDLTPRVGNEEEL
jgi:anaerobic dimethyl sulfoxide reductase subunit B (iron-sulfur subunit)